MSHKAVSWALEQRHLKPGPWIVLIQLADRHNKDTLQCDPDQKLIAVDCNMSRASVNRHLDDLEAQKLIRRIPRYDPNKKKPLSTFYILGLNFDNPPHVEFAMSQNETRLKQGQKGNISTARVSDCDTLPSLKSDGDRVSKNSKTVSQIATRTIVNKPVREPCAADAPHHGFDFGVFFDRVWRACPRQDSWSETEEAVKALIDDGEQPEEVLASVQAYARRVAGFDPSRIKFSQNFFAEGFWRQHVPQVAPVVDQAEILKRRAADIIEGKSFICRSITPHAAGECISAGLVTAADCRQAGIAV